MFGGGMSERTIGQMCDEKWNPNLLLYCDQTKSGIPFGTQFKIAGSGADEVWHPDELLVPEPPGLSLRCTALNIDTGIVAGPSGQPGATSLANPNGQGTVWLITRTRPTGDALRASRRASARRVSSSIRDISAAQLPRCLSCRRRPSSATASISSISTS